MTSPTIARRKGTLMAAVTQKPLSWFKPDPNQPRKDFPEAELRLLGESMRKKQLQPVLAQPDGTLIAGERRYRAAKLVGLPTLEVKIADEQLSPAQVKVWQLVENMQRADLSGYEKWLGCAELMCANPTWQLKDLAEALNLDPSMVTRLLSPSRCIPAAQEALKAGRVGISDCYAIGKLPEAEQAGLLALKLSGASRDKLEQAGRKARNGSKETVKLSKVKIALPKGMSVTISGNEVSMADVVELLAQTLAAAKKAAEQYDVKTFQSMMKDRARMV
jgi:ParB family chromosome partitioning protein